MEPLKGTKMLLHKTAMYGGRGGKRGNETTPVPEFSSLATNAKTAPVNLF